MTKCISRILKFMTLGTVSCLFWATANQSQWVTPILGPQSFDRGIAASLCINCAADSSAQRQVQASPMGEQQQQPAYVGADLNAVVRSLRNGYNIDLVRNPLLDPSAQILRNASTLFGPAIAPPGPPFDTMLQAGADRIMGGLSPSLGWSFAQPYSPYAGILP